MLLLLLLLLLLLQYLCECFVCVGARSDHLGFNIPSCGWLEWNPGHLVEVYRTPDHCSYHCVDWTLIVQCGSILLPQTLGNCHYVSTVIVILMMITIMMGMMMAMMVTITTTTMMLMMISVRVKCHNIPAGFNLPVSIFYLILLK